MFRIPFAVKAFLAQAKEEFNKKWEETPQVINPHCYCMSLSQFVKTFNVY